MRICITGSAGLIGSALSPFLRRLGFDVVGIDTRAPQGGAEYGDILDYDAFAERVSDVDGIVHLAAVSRVLFGEQDPKLCWETNVEGTQRVIEASLESPSRPWIVYASSREVYGQQQHLPVAETAPLAPVNIYGESKVAAEHAVEKGRERGVKGAIVRLSNVYGSLLDYADRVIPAFCAAAASGAPIRVDGKETLFDFTFIDDVVHGIVSLMYAVIKSRSPLPPIHLTTGRGVSLEEAALYARRASRHEIRVVEAPPRSFDVATFVGDPTRAQSLLHWNATVHIEEGIHRLITQYHLLAAHATS